MKPALLLAFVALAAILPSSAQTKKVVVTGPGYYYAPLGAAEISQLRAAAPAVNLVAPPKDRLLAEVADADGIIGIVNPEILRAATKLQWVQVGVAGVENFLTPELVNSNITLTNCKILQGPEIGDHAMALLLALTRGLYRAIPARATGEWAPRAYSPIELQGRTAVIVGMGGIGVQIAVRAHASGMHIIGVDPKDTPYLPFLRSSHPPDHLDVVLPEADVLFLAAPYTSETDRMIGARQFSLMKKNSYFIAVSRGKLYDHAALVKAIESGHLAGAGLDVTDPEPLPKDHPLWKFDNVVITPHIAGRSDKEHERYIALFKENLRRFAAGLPLLNVVDKRKGY